MAKRSRQSRVVQSVAIVVVTVVITLGGAELVFRMSGIPFLVKWIAPETRIAQFDSTLGWVYIPNLSRTQTFEGRPVPMHFNSIGARTSHPGKTFDPNAPTVIFVGGSFTMGHGVSYEESFVGQLDLMSEFPYQVVNLGVQAYGTDQSLLRLQRHFHDFNTRAVVYIFINDHIQRNANYDRRMFYPNGRFIGTKPLFAIQSDGSIALEKKPLLYENYHYYRVWALYRLALRNYYDPTSFDLTDALLREMKQYVESNGAAFLIIHWRRKNEAPVLFRHGIDAIDMANETPPDFDKWLITFHPDPRAHKFAGRLIAERLLPVLGDTYVTPHLPRQNRKR
jgi:hypothetical protein